MEGISFLSLALRCQENRGEERRDGEGIVTEACSGMHA